MYKSYFPQVLNMETSNGSMQLKEKLYSLVMLSMFRKFLISSKLIFILDNIKRKRIKTGGNPMNILREIQQLEQNQMQCNMSNCKFFLLFLCLFSTQHTIIIIIFSKRCFG